MSGWDAVPQWAEMKLSFLQGTFTATKYCRRTGRRLFGVNSFDQWKLRQKGKPPDSRCILGGRECRHTLNLADDLTEIRPLESAELQERYMLLRKDGLLLDSSFSNCYFFFCSRYFEAGFLLEGEPMALLCWSRVPVLTTAAFSSRNLWYLTSETNLMTYSHGSQINVLLYPSQNSLNRAKNRCIWRESHSSEAGQCSVAITFEYIVQTLVSIEKLDEVGKFHLTSGTNRSAVIPFPHVLPAARARAPRKSSSRRSSSVPAIMC